MGSVFGVNAISKCFMNETRQKDGQIKKPGEENRKSFSVDEMERYRQVVSSLIMTEQGLGAVVVDRKLK